MDGLILVRKPEGWTSHDVVAALRTILNQKKIGHFGTLDPMASGLLLAAAGKATRLFPLFGKFDKAYAGRIRFGFATDTYDAEGRPLTPERRDWPEQTAVFEALRGFEGPIIQIPPPFSAKKVGGKPLYAYARTQKSVEGRPFPTTVYSFRFKSYTPPELEVEVRCSSGTYVRTLAHDLGQRLGCGAHLTRLVRTEIGEYRLENAVGLDEIRAFQVEGRTDRFLVPMESLLPWLPKGILTETGLDYVRNGRLLGSEHWTAAETPSRPARSPSETSVRLFSPDGRWVALARPTLPEPKTLAPYLVFL